MSGSRPYQSGGAGSVYQPTAPSVISSPGPSPVAGDTCTRTCVAPAGSTHVSVGVPLTTTRLSTGESGSGPGSAEPDGGAVTICACASVDSCGVGDAAAI